MRIALRVCLLGPGTPGWITVTEQGIQQSFDMTRIMFSRGNITEKIRFGKLVQEGETVFDLYAGIGYYTLPALVHGKARHVYACEWNEQAANALTYNLAANGVESRATVLVGDCRQVAREHNLVDMFDRVSLGLLPSSEGGWRTAVKALRRDTGGWLHIHGNVPDRELHVWKHWTCKRLLSFVEDKGDSLLDWVVVCKRVERVKSYAPQIHHYVADVFVGPSGKLSTQFNFRGHRAGVVRENGEFRPCPLEIEPPSCALSSDGVLHQNWMMEDDSDELFGHDR